MGSLRGAVRAVIICDNLAAICNDNVIQDTSEVLQRSRRLVVWNFMPSFVDPRKAEVAIFAHLAVLNAVNKERAVAGSVEGSLIGVIDCKRNCFAAEPVANIVSIAVEECNADAVAENFREVSDERVDKVTGGGKAREDWRRARGCVVDIDTKGVLGRCKVKEIQEVIRRGGIIVGVTDVIDTAVAEAVVGPFDEPSAQTHGLGAGELALVSASVRLLAVLDLIIASLWEVECLLCESVYCVVVCLDAVSVIDSELRVVRTLNLLIDNTVDDTKSVHLEWDTFGGAILDGLVLLIEIVVEARSIVPSVTLGPQVERQVLDICVKLRRQLQEGLQDVPSTNGSSMGCIGRVRVDERVPAILVGFGGFVRKPHTCSRLIS